MSREDKINWRMRLVHGVVKSLLPMTIWHLHNTFRKDDALIMQPSDFQDTRNHRYKMHYYDLTKKILKEGKMPFEDDHPVSMAHRIFFTMIDADEAYEELLKEFYEEEEKYFKKKFGIMS